MGEQKPIEPIMRNATGTVWCGPCLLHSIFVDADGVAAEVDVCDGFGTGGVQRFRINALSNDSKLLVFPVPLKLRLGLYLVVNAATTFVTMQIEPQ